MASVSSIPKTHFHARSVSFPCRSSQISEINDVEATTSSSSIGQKVNNLQDLYSSVGNLLLLPATHGSLAQGVVNELLDELLGLLELCGAAKDSLLMTKDSAQELQSVLRRKRGGTNELSCAIQEYQSQRKAIKKIILKALRHLKGSSIKKIQETPGVVTLREAESVTLRVFESILCFLLGSNTQTASNKWSLVSKLMGLKHIACDESSEKSQVGKVDAELAKKSTCFQVENVQKELAQLELSLEDLQEGIEAIYRHLIKTRVSLLNLLNH